MIEIATQGATESLDPSGIPMGEIGEGAIFDFTVFAEGLAEEDGGWRLGMEEMYMPTSYHKYIPCQHISIYYNDSATSVG